MNRGAILLLVLCIIALIGYFSVAGFYLKSAEDLSADEVTKSATAWLNTDEGRDKFPGGMTGESIPVYIENTAEIFYWNVPVKNNEGMYLGLIITDAEEFDMPSAVLNFPEPREFIFFSSKDDRPMTRDDAYSQMIEQHPEYSAGQITKPRVVASGGTIYWMSEVTENGEISDELYIGIRSY